MKWFRRALLLGALGLPSLLPARDTGFNEAASNARTDLEAALHELAESRQASATDRVPLVRRQRELEAEVAKLRREYQSRVNLREMRRREIESLRAEQRAREDQYHYQRGLLGEYLRELETVLPVSEFETFAPLLRTPTDDDGDRETPTLLPELKAVRLSLARINEQIGGRGYDGEAAGPDGILETGRFLEIGPVLLFSSERFAGFAEERIGSLKAHVSVTGRDHPQHLRQLVATGKGILPLDPTLGQAARRAEARTGLADKVRAGGVVMVPILALAAAALVIALLKWLQIAGIQVAAPELLQRILALLEGGKKEEAQRLAAAVRGPVGGLLQNAIEHAGDPKEVLEEILYENILRAQPRLERYLPFLALTAATAPLLGLLGTVTGMINTFQIITLFGTGDARTLSGGISEALITTQFGLGVAIVSLLVHALLSRKAKGVIANMEQTEAALLNGLATPVPAGSRPPAEP